MVKNRLTSTPLIHNGSCHLCRFCGLCVEHRHCGIGLLHSNHLQCMIADFSVLQQIDVQIHATADCGHIALRVGNIVHTGNVGWV